MSDKNVGGSQQQGQGVTIGNQGNEDMNIPGSAPHGPNNPQSGSEDERKIPGQEHSSRTSEEQQDQRS